MNQKSQSIFIRIFLLGLPMVLGILAAIGIIFLLISEGNPSMPVSVITFSERVNVVLDTIHLGFGEIPLETQNFLLFQSFQSEFPQVFTSYSQVLGLLFWIALCLGLVLLSELKKWPFILAIGVAIFLFTLSGVNSLNIGGIGSNYGFLMVLLGLILPVVVIHLFFPTLGMLARIAIILSLGLLTYFSLIQFAQVKAPTLLLGENLSLMVLAIAAFFLFYIGHGAISGIYYLLAKLNKGVGLKISWHLSIFSFVYLFLLALYFFRLMGDLDLGIPLPYEYLLFLVVATLAFLENRRKIRHVKQPYEAAVIGEGLFLIGFAITSLVWFKSEISSNTSMLDFLKHTFIYTQLGFSILFYLYLITNFLGVMNTGQAIDRIIYTPPFFPYFHMRFGAMLTVLILVIYANGIIAVQFSTASTNLSADYYFATDRPTEAAILYENAWERYRNNPKNLNAVAHIHLAQNQPTAAQQFLMRSFDEKPNVPNILLLATQLQGNSKMTEALYYLEEGLRFFPNDPYLLNSLALLKSKTNASEEAFERLSEMESEKEVSLSNRIGLKALHGVGVAGVDQDELNHFGRINLMAVSNLGGEVATFTLKYDTISEPSLVNQAVLRNQWTNSVSLDLEGDTYLVDSLITLETIPSREADWRESKLIRDYKGGNINAVIRSARSLAFNFKGSAGFYHSLEAKVLSGARDFSAAGKAWKAAFESGYQNVRQEHLPIIYFGGYPDEAREIAELAKVPMPKWMVWDESGDLIENDTVLYVQGLANLHPGLLEDLLETLEAINNQGLKAGFALELIRHKFHWMEGNTFEYLSELVMANFQNEENRQQFYEWTSLLESGEFPTEELKGFFGKYFASRGRGDAYRAPLVMMAVAQAEEDLEKYELLQEATSLNKDPLLWIHLVKYSRILGLDHYASRSLVQMGEWVPAEKLTALQLNHL
ncbi:tetratricopeptide repeat protein [Pleomorphovibrio marinus]|uniref:hypothetical protein n=1 Tax=Pleomorphovibrio marinus TaxID=2164132 RepID=UPI001300ADA8|nr:hypothetical protein [Pleomorphovibrio marinus]